MAGIVGALALAVIVGCLFLLFRRRARVEETGTVESLGQTQLDENHAVHLMRVGQRILLIGVCGTQIRCLGEVTDPREAAMLLDRHAPMHGREQIASDPTGTPEREPILGASFAEALSNVSGKPLSARSRRRLARREQSRRREKASQARHRSSTLYPVGDHTPGMDPSGDDQQSSPSSETADVSAPTATNARRTRSKVLRLDGFNAAIEEQSSAESRISQFKERMQEMRKLG